MEKVNKNIIVLFSGGLDSTFLLWKNVKEQNNVYPVYIEITGNVGKTSREKEATSRIIGKLREDDYSHHLNDIKFPYKFDNSENFIGDCLYFKQLPIWILGILMSLELHIDEVHIGYVMNDDATAYIKEIKKLFKAYKPFISNQKVKLKFPLRKHNKEQIWNSLPERYKQETVFCENPLKSEDGSYTDCSGCDSCRTYKHKELFWKYNRNNSPITEDINEEDSTCIQLSLFENTNLNLADSINLLEKEEYEKKN